MMIWLTNLQHYLTALDRKKLYQYLGGIIGSIIFIMAILIINYYRKVSTLKAEIELVNEMRQEIKILLDQAQHVKTEQKEIDMIITKDPSFKVAGYFDSLIEKLNLSRKKDSRELDTPVREGNYQETILTAKFTGMNMEELTMLLEEIDKNKRIFSKMLDITASKKAANSIDVTLTIAALEPKGFETGSEE